MTQVKDILVSALNILGRAELAGQLAEGKTLSDEGEEMVNVLLFCFNAVEDELARNYFPLKAKEDIKAVSGKVTYAKFANSPVKIKRVLADGKEIEYTVFPEYIAVDASKITVEYEYAPSKKQAGQSSDFGVEVSEYLMALGTAAEYCLINGEIEASEFWEKKYREQIDVAQRTIPSGGNIPPRRWV